MYIPSLSLLLILALMMLTRVTDSARILAVLPYNARSHFIVIEPLLLALHAKGHHLTVVSSFPQKKPLQNFRDIDLSKTLPSVISNFTLDGIRKTMPHLFQTTIFITELHMKVCEKVMKEEKVMNLLEEKFDLMIGEIFGSDCFNYFAYKLEVPYISWVTSVSLPWIAERSGLPDNPSYIPNYFVDYFVDSSNKMGYLERLVNFVSLLYTKAAYYYFSEVPSRSLAERVFRHPLPSMEELNSRVSLILVNSHFSLAQSRPFPPNVVEVGGIHIKEVQPLPQDLKVQLDNAKDGVILFSFGSLVRVSSLPRHVIRAFLDVFSELPQLVVFKYEEDLPEVPPNVIVRKWLPQTDIIAHPSVRAVITHCGLASTIEAVHFAKPVVAVPFFSDQFLNAKNVVKRGGGVMLDINHLTQKDIHEALKAVLEDSSYAANMARLSEKFRDRPLTALQSAVYWTEYVIRHQGAPQLRPASVGLPMYQYNLCDVIALLLIPLVYVLYTLLRWLRTKVFSVKHTVRKDKKSKKFK